MHRHDPGSRNEGVTGKGNPIRFPREDRCDLLEVGDGQFIWAQWVKRAGDGRPLRKPLTFLVDDWNRLENEKRVGEERVGERGWAQDAWFSLPEQSRTVFSFRSILQREPARVWGPML